MKKKIILLLLALCLLISTMTTTFAANPDILTPSERHYFENRGLFDEDILKIPQDEFSRRLNELRRFPLPYAAPSGYVAVSGIPGNSGGAQYFHPNTGLSDGLFTEQTVWFPMQNGPRRFAYEVFRTNSISDKYLYYYMWGEWDNSAKTHQGVDMRYNSDPSRMVTSAHDGEVIYVDENTWGAVGIYDEGSELTHYYLHLDSISVSEGDIVTVNDSIGNQGAVGLDSSSDYHVHYELHNGYSTVGPQSTAGLNTEFPYYFMGYMSDASRNPR